MQKTTHEAKDTAAMPLTPEDIQTYLEQGYLIVRGLLSGEELAELRQDIVALCRGQYTSPHLPKVPEEWSDARALADILCIFNAHRISPTMERYASHPGLVHVLAGLVGAHLPHWDGRVKTVQSQVFVKPPGFQGMAWHQDEAYIPTRDRSLCAAWIAIDPVDESNGCLRVIPKSHQMGYLWPQKPHGDTEEFDFAPECYGFDASTEIPVPLDAGDALFINGYLMHRSTKNRSEGLRRVLSYHCMNAWSLLPWLHPRGMDPVSVADVRTILPVHGDDPYAWKGRQTGGDVALRTCSSNSDALNARYQGQWETSE